MADAIATNTTLKKLKTSDPHQVLDLPKNDIEEEEKHPPNIRATNPVLMQY